MKYTYKPAPNYRNKQTTSGIMLDLTICLLVVLAASVYYYATAYGMDIALRAIGMTAASVVAALVTEFVYFKMMKTENVVQAILHSYGWVTAIILTLITRIDVSYYALIISTIICIIAGKLVFGGFGQNIFNPAAFGEAIIMNAFASSTAPSVTNKVYDVLTGGTPMAVANSYGWVIDNNAFGDFIHQFGGFGNMLLGNYPSVIGGSAAIVILLCGVFMLIRKDIDWHLSVTYLVFVFLLSLIVGFFHGSSFQYALFNMLGGGALFGCVFMMTDPVTTPVTIPGRMIFAVGCAALTLILRWKANLPDGVLFSILLMNMMTPAIDKLVDGNQIKNASLIKNKVLITSAIISVIAILVGATVEGKVPEVKAEETTEETSEASASGESLGASDYSKLKAECTDEGDGVYACKAKGFAGTNEAKITVEGGKITAYEITNFKDDGDGVGDELNTEDKLAKYIGATLDSSIDAESGATMTDNAFKAMAQAALQAAGE